MPGVKWIAPSIPPWAAQATACITASACVLALAIGVPRLRAMAHAAPPPAEVSVRFVDAPTWLGVGDLASLRSTAATAAGTDASDNDGLRRAMEALHATGWFAAVRQVRRPSVDELVVEADFAQPFALVSDGAGEHLIDTSGILLPRTYAAGTAPAFPCIVGAHESRPPRPGMRWMGADIAAGIGLARMLDGQRWRGQIESIDVQRYPKEGHLEFQTTGGCRVIWGRPPGEESPAEVPAWQKIRALQFLAATTGRIDGGAQGTLDLMTDCVGLR